MRKLFGNLFILLAVSIPAGVLAQDNGEGPPPWAFAMDPPQTAELAHRTDDNVPRHVPNSNVTLTRAQTIDLLNVPDWHPDDHPPAPDIIMHGHRPSTYACGYCHLPNGLGIPEDVGLAGMSVGYITQQIADYKNGTRTTAKPEMVSYKGMLKIAKALTDDETRQAAEYYASFKAKPWIQVKETSVIPKMHIVQYMFVPTGEAGTEPLGKRIIETPANLELTDLHDSQSGYIAYVPIGSIKKGEAIVKKGPHGPATACASCHGPDLRGGDLVPPIAGRSPSYIVRQLYNIEHGARTGDDVMPMQDVVTGMTVDTMISLAAYVSSRAP